MTKDIKWTANKASYTIMNKYQMCLFEHLYRYTTDYHEEQQNRKRQEGIKWIL
jgi:hypothetical protein